MTTSFLRIACFVVFTTLRFSACGGGGGSSMPAPAYGDHGYSADVARLGAGNTRSAPHSKDLSPRERDVLAYVLRGRTNAEIAATLNISERTVESHVRAVLAKHGVKSRLQLISSEKSAPDRLG